MYPNPLNITLKNVKTFNGMEGQGFSATMYVDGKVCCDVIDDANGGCYHYNVAYDRKAGARVAGAEALLDKAHAFCKTLPLTPWPESCGGGEGPDGSKGYQPDLDAFVSELVQQIDTEKRLARARKNATLFSVDGDEGKGIAYRSIKTLDKEVATRVIDKQFGAGKWRFI